MCKFSPLVVNFGQFCESLSETFCCLFNYAYTCSSSRQRYICTDTNTAADTDTKIHLQFARGVAASFKVIAAAAWAHYTLDKHAINNCNNNHNNCNCNNFDSKTLPQNLQHDIDAAAACRFPKKPAAAFPDVAR